MILTVHHFPDVRPFRRTGATMRRVVGAWLLAIGLAAPNVEIRAPFDVVDARATAGSVVHVERGLVRMRPPEVCAPARIYVTAGGLEGRTVTFGVDVFPTEPSPRAKAVPRIVLLPSAGGDAVDVQLATAGTVSFVTSAGSLSPAEGTAFCRVGRWVLPPTRRPRIEVIAAFEFGQLVAWTTLTRAAAAVLELKADPLALVTADLGGRRFFARADAQGDLRLHTEVPPGVLEIVTRSGGKTLRIPLDVPPADTVFALRAPDGSTWQFRATPEGAPRDALGSVRAGPPERPQATAAPARAVPPEGASRPLADAAPKPLPARSAVHVGRAPVGAEAAPESPLPWRLGGGVTLGPSADVGVALVLQRRWARASSDLSAGSVLLAGQASDAILGRDRRLSVRSGGAALWAEAGIPWPWPRLRLAAGAGFAGAWQRYDASFQRTTNVVSSGPLATFACAWRVAGGEVDARLLASTATLGARESTVLGLLGFSARLGSSR